MSYHITIPARVHSDHLWLGYLSIQEMRLIANDLRCIHVRVLLFRYYPDHDPLNSVADNRSPIILTAKRCGIRMVYESELENFEEFPAGSNIFQHNHGDVCDAPDIHVPMSDLSPPRIINCERSRQMTYHITIPTRVHSDHLWLGYLSIQEMRLIATQYSDPNDLRCIHVKVLLFRYYPDHDPLNSVANNRSPIILTAKRCGIRMVYESELENFEEFPAGSNIFQHNYGDVFDAPDVLHTLVPMSDLSPPRIINCESNSLGLRAPSPHNLGILIPT
ncbi:hypothetical protein Q3G72_030270 [Acer saccharum]|nr:hypothetical protein Q3G72_030270 [Acer saccharum]